MKKFLRNLETFYLSKKGIIIIELFILLGLSFAFWCVNTTERELQLFSMIVALLAFAVFLTVGTVWVLLRKKSI